MISPDIHPSQIVVDIFVRDRLHTQYTLRELEDMANGVGAREFDPVVARVGELLAKVAG